MEDSRNRTREQKMASRRRPPPLKWQPLAPPTPRILNFPVRRRGFSSTESRKMKQRGTTKRLEALFDEERVFGKEEEELPVYSVPIVLLNTGGEERGRKEEESGEVAGVEAEMLRAECRFLRMERELALKKVKRNRARMERILRSAVQTLVSVRDGVAAEIGDGGFLCVSLDEEIKAMRCRLVDLQKVTGGTKLVFDAAHRSCSNSSNVDDQASLIVGNGYGLDWGNQIVPKQIQEMAEASLCLSVHTGFESFGGSSRFTDVELLSRKMEGLSDGTMFERMDEAKGSRLLSKVGSSVASSASTSWRWRIEMPHLDLASYSTQQAYQEGMADEGKPCSARCRAVVRRITEQVRIETEQWSQMQKMLDKVRDEMEQLQASRDKWEWQALDFENQNECLNSTIEEWKQKALSEETKVSDLQSQLEVLQEELKILRREQARTNIPYLTSTDMKKEKEKRVLICELKENHSASSDSKRRRNVSSEEKRKQYSVSKKLEVLKRSPFQDIGNSSPLMRQITKVVFPAHRR